MEQILRELNHIITEHADDFLNKGITQEQIPDYVMNALENGKIVGYQGKRYWKNLYMNLTYNGEIHKVAITVGNNGFIVGANPKDSVKMTYEKTEQKKKAQMNLENCRSFRLW